MDMYIKRVWNQCYFLNFRGRSAAPFCTPNEASDNRITCSADKKALARCQVKNWPAMLPRPFQVSMYVPVNNSSHFLVFILALYPLYLVL